MSPLSLAIVGFGRLAESYYLPALARLPDVSLTAVADAREASRQRAARLAPKAKIVSSAEALVAETAGQGLDGVLVATPPTTHLALWHTLKPHGAHVFMEKPFLLRHELASVEPADPAWHRLAVNYNRRFWPNYQALRQSVASVPPDKVQSAHFELLVDPAAWAAVSDHRARSEEGGALYDLGGHVLGLIELMLGAWPSSLSAHRVNDTEVEDGYHITASLTSGVTATARFGYAAKGRETVRIRAAGGEWRSDNPNGAWWHYPDGRSPTGKLWQYSVDLALLGVRGLLRDRSMLRHSIYRTLTHFVASVRTGAAHDPGFGFAYRIAESLAAVAESVATGAAVQLGAPLEPAVAER